MFVKRSGDLKDKQQAKQVETYQAAGVGMGSPELEGSVRDRERVNISWA